MGEATSDGGADVEIEGGLIEDITIGKYDTDVLVNIVLAWGTGIIDRLRPSFVEIGSEMELERQCGFSLAKTPGENRVYG